MAHYHPVHPHEAALPPPTRLRLRNVLDLAHLAVLAVRRRRSAEGADDPLLAASPGCGPCSDIPLDAATLLPIHRRRGAVALDLASPVPGLHALAWLAGGRARPCWQLDAEPARTAARARPSRRPWMLRVASGGAEASSRQSI
jgi:hypothetical protein